MSRLTYEEIRELTPDDVARVLSRGDPRELLYVPLSVGLHADDPVWAQGVCTGLASHPDGTVRGNALLGLGHIARVHGVLDEGVARPLLLAGLDDESEHVRGQARSAIDDVEHCLGWQLVEDPIRDWFEGEAVPAARFRLNEPVRIVEGEHAGEVGAVIWWAGPHDPERYFVEVGHDGSEVDLPAGALKPVMPTDADVRGQE